LLRPSLPRSQRLLGAVGARHVVPASTAPKNLNPGAKFFSLSAPPHFR
jgi:hypothetical protein